MRRTIHEFNLSYGVQSQECIVGGSASPTCDFRVRFCNAAVDQSVKDCWAHAATRCRRVREGRRLSQSETTTGASLFSRLRKSVTDTYGRVPGVNPYVPFVASKIKESDPKAPVVGLVPNLPAEIGRVISNPELTKRPLTPEEEVEFRNLCKRYDFFGGEPEEWPTYHHRPDVWGLWAYEEDSPEYIPHAVLSVPRAKDDLLRRIGASVPINYAWYRPEDLFPELARRLGLLGGALLASVFCDTGSIFWALLDESCCFTSLLTPEFWWACHAGPRVKAGDIPRRLWKPGWTAKTVVRPLSKRLGMGNCWSVFLIMVIHLKVVTESLANCLRLEISRFVVLNSSVERESISPWLASQGVVYIHVDDFAFGHSNEDLANLAAITVNGSLRALGFVVDYTPTYRVRKVVGLAVPTDGSPILDVPLIRLGDLDRALEILEDAPVILPAMLRTVVCVYTWFGLMWRMSYSAIGPIFQWLQRHEGRDPVVPWDGVRRAIRRMRACLPFIFAALDRQLAPVALAQDAAGGSSSGAQGPTGSFSLAFGFPQLCDLSQVFYLCQLRNRNSISYSKVLEQVTASEFPGENDMVARTSVPYRLFEKRWFQVLAGKWHRSDHINCGETRAAILWDSILGLVSRWRGSQFLDLGDNQAANGCLIGGRSPSPPTQLAVFQGGLGRGSL